MNVEKTVDNFSDVVAGITALASTRVYAGVPATKAARDDGPINNAALMYIHENGAPEANIPPRPVVHPAIKDIEVDLDKDFQKVAGYALDGKPDAVEKGYNAIGLRAQNAMQNRIVAGPFIPLKKKTIAARKRAGFAGVKPLIRTGKLKASLTYVVRKIPWFR